jgi:hypothetical protein
MYKVLFSNNSSKPLFIASVYSVHKPHKNPIRRELRYFRDCCNNTYEGHRMIMFNPLKPKGEDRRLGTMQKDRSKEK